MILSLLSFPLPPGECVAVERGKGRGRGRGRGVAAPYPLLPLEEEDPGSRGLLVGVGVLGVVFWPPASAGPHIPVYPGRSFMLFAGLMALAGAAVVDHAQRRPSDSGLGSWASSPSYVSPQLGRGRSLRPPTPRLSSVCWRITGGPRCPRRLFWAALCYCCVGV